VLLDLLSELRSTITRYPMKHLGYSFYEQHYSIVSFNRDSQRLLRHRSYRIDTEFLIRQFGTFNLRREYYELFRLVGGLITGTDAILQQWAQWTANVRKDKGISAHQALDILTTTPETERNVEDARKVYREMLASRGKLDCVWTHRPVRAPDLDVDHAIPYSLSRNNDLWNLLPTHRFVNAKKRDRVPSPQLVAARAGSIREYWESLRGSYPDLFQRQFL